jgi:predicted metalloprotease with PDZ domain
MDLSVNDELIGIDGYRFNRERASYYIANKAPGSLVKLSIARNGLLREATGKLAEKPPFEYRIVPMNRSTEEQKRLFKGWLREDWRPDITYPEYAKSPDRKNSLDYV